MIKRQILQYKLCLLLDSPFFGRFYFVVTPLNCIVDPSFLVIYLQVQGPFAAVSFVLPAKNFRNFFAHKMLVGLATEALFATCDSFISRRFFVQARLYQTK